MKNEKSLSPSHPHPFFSSPNKSISELGKIDNYIQRYPAKRSEQGSVSKKKKKVIPQCYEDSLISTLSPYSKSIFQNPGEQEQIENKLKLFIQNPNQYGKQITKHKPYFQFYVNNWENDFYYDLLDWSHQTNTICVGNKKQISLYNANTTSTLQEFQKSKVCFNSLYDVTTVKFSERDISLAVGKINGNIDIFDYEKQKLKNVFQYQHVNEISALDWKQHLITGDRTGNIFKRDLRTKKIIFDISIESQICAIKQNNGFIAVGTDSHEVLIFDSRTYTLFDAYQHTAAVKALCWKPSTRHLISGGGMKCKMIKVWSPNEGIIKSYKTQSQISNIIHSKTSQQFVTTHGYGLKRMIKWKDFGKIQSVYQGHEDRIIYSSQSPDNGTIITGSPDNKVLFWKVFQKQNSNSFEFQSDLR